MLLSTYLLQLTSNLKPLPVFGVLQRLRCNVYAEGGLLDLPLARLLELELPCDERNPVKPNFTVLGQPVTSQVRSSHQSRYRRRKSFGRYRIDQNNLTVIKIHFSKYPNLDCKRKRSPKVIQGQ